VVAHLAVSVDGDTRGFAPDLELFYRLARDFNEDLTLTGADTILAQEPALAELDGPGPDLEAPLLAVVDSRARVSAWEALRDAGHWRGVVALRSAASPASATGPAATVVAGESRVDLAAALAELARGEGIGRVRVDSGGALAAAMLAGGLVDELSLLIHPVVSGGGSWLDSFGGDAALELAGCESFAGGIVWIRYRVGRT
jgi:2,5-diamino-6-(ribosylamino)-4(3H)-pyrimidinone 5'-phosphate reductase